MRSESLVRPPASRKIKAGRVRLSKGEEIGEHVTGKREEMLVVLRGTATVTLEGVKKKLAEGGTLYIGEGKKHNVSNGEDGELEYVYVVCLDA